MSGRKEHGSLSGTDHSPEDAFAALGNEHRMKIVHELGKRQSTDPRAPDQPVAFSELLAATGIEDKGQFNYHLGKLADVFVEKQADGYILTHAGKEVIRAVRAGTLTSRPDTEPVPVEGVSCPYCDSEHVWFSYENGFLFFGCDDCEGFAVDDPNEPLPGIIQAGRFPASGLAGRTLGEVYRLGPIWGNFVHRLLSEGLCPSCAGPVEADVTLCPDHPVEGVCETCESRHAGGISYACTVCGYGEAMPLWGRALVHEEMFRFAYERGVNLNRPSMADFELTRGITEEVISTDPVTVRYSFPIAGDTLTLTIDDELAVTNTSTTLQP
jgi:hypothetical protein